ncbi:MAG: Calx-beta domain-containing protein [Acidimicrobiales bacterium]
MFALVAGMATAVATVPASAAPPTTEVVSEGDIAPGGSWALEPTSNTGTYGFVSGPGTPPSGIGSLAMTIASGQHEWLNNYAYGVCATGPCNTPATMTPIGDLDALSYSTNRASGTTMPTFNIEVYITGIGGYTTLAFVPSSGLVVDGTWQTWDGLNPADGVWYSSQNVGSGVFNCGPFSCSASWSQVTAAYPNAKVVYGLGPNLGTGGTFTGHIDSFTVGVAGATTIFDFEPMCTTTCHVAPSGDDDSSGLAGDPLATIQAGIDTVQAGGDVQVSAGSFAENVVVDKDVRVHGAGATTVVVPAISDPNCGGAGGGSLCAGSSNVFLVEADGVEIDHLTVDGDNASLTGLVVGGADVDARNGIITNHAIGQFNSLSVHDVTVRNIYLRGVYASSGGSFDFSDNVVDNVQGDPGSIGIFNFEGGGIISGNQVSNANDAIASNWSTGTQFTDNTVTSSASGVHTDNAGANGGTADLLSGNDVSACSAGGYGVYAFVPYLAPTISDNTVSGCEVGLAAFGSCNSTAGNLCPGSNVPTITFTGNTVSGIAGGMGLYASTTIFSFGDREVRVAADHNTIYGADEGVYVEETAGQTAQVAVNRNALGGNTVHAVQNAGATTVDAMCNWWGQGAGPTPTQTLGAVNEAPWLVTSNLDSSCTPIVRFGSASAATVVEGNSGTTNVTVNVKLDRQSSMPVSVFWSTLNGTAKALDYVGGFGGLLFAPGETSKMVTVAVKGDVTVEDLETFTLNLSSPTNAVLGPAAVKPIDIINDDKSTMSVANVSVVEGASATFTVTLAHRYYLPVTVAVSSANGSATAPSDYVAVPGGATVVIPAGSTTGTISVATDVDGQTEPAQGFTLTFTSTGVTNSPRTAIGTIQANST